MTRILSSLLFILIASSGGTTDFVNASSDDVDSCASSVTDKCTDCAKPWCFVDAETGSGVCKTTDTQEISGKLERWENTDFDVDEGECECNWDGKSKCSSCDKAYCYQDPTGGTSKCLSFESWYEICEGQAGNGGCNGMYWRKMSYNYPDNCSSDGMMTCDGISCHGDKFPCCYEQKCWSYEKFYSMQDNRIMVCHLKDLHATEYEGMYAEINP